MSGLATVCPCGHTANYHPSIEQQRVQLDATDGRFPGSCQYRPGANHHACRCITSREELTATTDCHDWIDRGTTGDLWRECWLCGEVRLHATPTPSEEP